MFRYCVVAFHRFKYLLSARRLPGLLSGSVSGFRTLSGFSRSSKAIPGKAFKQVTVLTASGMKTPRIGMKTQENLREP